MEHHHRPEDPVVRRYWQVKVNICERGEDTRATVVLRVDPTRELQASGHSARGHHDPSVPKIGDEVAVARALHSLADQLLATASADIERTTGELDVSLH